MPQDSGLLLWTLLAALVLYGVHTIRRWRWMRFQQYAEYPQAGKPSFLMGHGLVLRHLFINTGDRRRHIGKLDLLTVGNLRSHGDRQTRL